MKKFSYQFPVEVNIGTENDPNVRMDLYPKEFTCTEENYESALSIAQEESYNGKVTVEEVPMTDEEARTLRDKLLAETDWTQTLDAPISTASKEAFRVYRQALRDVPQQADYPNTINWPVKPEAVKADPEPVDTVVDAIIGEEGLE